MENKNFRTKIGNKNQKQKLGTKIRDKIWNKIRKILFEQKIEKNSRKKIPEKSQYKSKEKMGIDAYPHLMRKEMKKNTRKGEREKRESNKMPGHNNTHLPIEAPSVREWVTSANTGSNSFSGY